MTEGAGPIGGVVFDFYGTLVEQHPDDAAHDRQLLAERGYHLIGAVRRAWVDPYTALEHRADSADRERYQRRRPELWRAAFRDAGVEEHLVDELASLAEQRDASRRYTPYPDVLGALAGLRRRGLRTAICSNWGWDLADAVAAAGLADLIDVVVTSAQAGYRKPHPEVFSVVVEQLAIAADRLLFVGDTWGADVAGAAAVGMQPVHLVRSVDRDELPPPCPPGIVRLAGLAELRALLDDPGTL